MAKHRGGSFWGLLLISVGTKARSPLHWFWATVVCGFQIYQKSLLRSDSMIVCAQGSSNKFCRFQAQIQNNKTQIKNQSLEKYEDQRRTDDGVRARRVQMNSAAGKLPPKFLLMISLQTPQISTYENINTNNNKYTNKVTRTDMNSFTCNGPSA